MTLVVTWLWQGLALAALTAVVLRALPRVNAATHHLTLWTALAAILGIPLMLAAGSLRDHVGVLPLPPAGNGFDAALVLPAAPRWVAVLCASTWTAVAVVGLVRIVRGGHVLRMLRRNSTPFDPAREARLPLWLEAGRSARRRAELRVSNELPAPVRSGSVVRIILVSRRLADALDDAALDQIVMHEQAHLVRRDDWWQCAGARPRRRRTASSRLVAIAPDRSRARSCVRRPRGRAHRGCAAVCPGIARRGHDDRLAAHGAALVPGATGRVSTLRLRVARLLDPQRPRGVRPTPIAALTMWYRCWASSRAHTLPRSSRSSMRSNRRCHRGQPVRSPQWRRRAHRRSTRLPPSRCRRRLLTCGQSAATGSTGRCDRPDAGAHGRRYRNPRSRSSRPLRCSKAGCGLAGNAALAIAAPAGTMDSPKLAATRGQASWQTLANTTSNIAKGTASSVASGAGRSGLAIGRAFTRAGQAIGGSF